LAALAFGINDLKAVTNVGFGNLRARAERNVVEGALVSIETETGYITAIVGGSKYDESNQLIRASQAYVQPGSAFKPLYYSAAIDSRKFTAASLIYDLPIVYHNVDGTPYIPQNFRGEYSGSTLFYNALSRSMNIPSVKIRDDIGFDAAIDRSAALLGITDQNFIRRNFPRVYPLALGVSSTSPLHMARAFAIFGNQGREVTPIAIRYVEDRNGRVLLDPERELRLQQRRAANPQVISQQNAYIMTKILEKTVEEGTLAHAADWGAKFTFRDENGRSFKMPVAGKTGTPQNWSDAWTVGYSPYYATAIWFGFDKPGNSLGVDLTGSVLAGPVWGNYMREIHQGLARKDFARPATGIIDATVCAKSGLLRSPACNQGSITLPFLAGTQPTSACEHGNWATTVVINNMRENAWGVDGNMLLGSLELPGLPSLPADLFPDLAGSRGQSNRPAQGGTQARNPSESIFSWPLNNPLLDGDEMRAPAAVPAPPPPALAPVPAPPPAPAPAETEAGFQQNQFGDLDFVLEIPSYNPLLE
jgi:penicillin-binding protein 1A